MTDVDSSFRSDFGQFWSGSAPAAPPPGGADSPSVPLIPNPQPAASERGDAPTGRGTLNPEPSTRSSPWSLQPGEPPADYALFAAWLKLAPPRRFTNCAAALGLPLARLRRLSSRHHWRSRAKAFELHQARAQSRALEQLTLEKAADWKARAENFRLREWALHEELIEAASIAARELRAKTHLLSLNDICKLMDLGFTLGRLACNMPLNAPAPQLDRSASNAEFESALEKVYGQNSPFRPPDRKEPPL